MTKPSFSGEFPIAKKNMEAVGKLTKFLARFDKNIDAIKEAVEAGEILNTTMNDVKGEVNSFVNYAFEQTVDGPYYYGGKYQQLPSDLQDLSSPSDVRGLNVYVKKLAKISAESKKTECFKVAADLAAELMPLYTVMEYLKSVTVKVSEKRAAAKAVKENEEAAYQKKYTAHKDVQKVVNLLKDKAAEVEKSIFESQLNYLKSIVASYKKAVDEGETNYMNVFRYDPFAAYTMQGLCERVYEGGLTTRERKFKLMDDWEAKIKADAKKTAANIVDGFVYKNSGKLSYILYTKNNMKDVELKNVSIRRGAVEATLHVTFEDGSEFQADSSVVNAVSKLGRPFLRYPTIFRNVKLPDGSKMPQPSEQKMDEVFAVTK